MQLTISESNAKVSKEIFEFIFNAVPLENGTVMHSRQIGIAHFSFLAEKIGIGLDDLSFYLLAFYLKCSNGLAFHISEASFVAGLSQAFLSENRTVSSENDYADAFHVLRGVVQCVHEKVLQNPVDCENFYNFLYAWCLKNNRASDRTLVATELWELFFTDKEPAAGAKTFKHYVHFPNLKDWITFASTEDFAKKNMISSDLWHQLFFFAKLQTYDRYNADDAWPLALDSFVEWYKQGRAAR